jgi:hypothetical protein
MNYENDIRIDTDALDIEWTDQAMLFMKYAKNAAQCRMDLDRAKEKLDLVKAELDKSIRNKPDKYGIEKITETVVTNTIIAQDGFKEANDEYLDAKYNADIAQSAVNAMNQRKEALENLVKLHGMQYFAGPKMPRNLSDERRKKEEQNREQNAGIASRMQRRSKL